MSAGATEARRQRRARLRGLYAITPERAGTAALVADVAAALRGGAAIVQYRAKTLPAPLRLAQAQALAEACRAAGALFIVNDDARLAAAVRADGVHVGREDGAVAEARALVGDDALIGVSCYDQPALAHAALAAGADYVAHGSLFASRVKPDAVRASLDLVRASAALPLPVVGIGGIDASNASSVIAAGGAAVAVITALFDAGDVEAAARALAAACVRHDSTNPGVSSKP